MFNLKFLHRYAKPIHYTGKFNIFGPNAFYLFRSNYRYINTSRVINHCYTSTTSNHSDKGIAEKLRIRACIQHNSVPETYKDVPKITITLDTDNDEITIDDMVIKYTFYEQQFEDCDETNIFVNLAIKNKKQYDDDTLIDILERLSEEPLENMNLIIDELLDEL